MVKKQIALSILFWMFIFSILLRAQHQLSVIVDKPIAEIQPTMWGVFYEEINFAADGGIYAELIKNRSFEFYISMMGWEEIKRKGGKGRYLVINRGEAFASNLRFIRMTCLSTSGAYGLSNSGFRGIGIKKAIRIIFQCWPGSKRVMSG